MNEILKRMKTNKIVLDDRFSLVSDTFKGLVLVLEEPRTRIKKDTGEEEDYIFVDKWYHLTLSQTLENYLKQVTLKATSIEELKDIVLRVAQTISKLK
jgi:hypothetical protein